MPWCRRGCGIDYLVKRVHCVPNVTARQKNICLSLSSTTRSKVAFSRPKTSLAIGGGQVRCALYKAYLVPNLLEPAGTSEA